MNTIVQNKTLPIFDKQIDIIEAMHKNQVVIISGETGSGKTSRLPILCYEAGFGRHGKIGITQPRRIAATSVASYVAELLKCPLGSFVGYKVRFSDKESYDTKIKFMTDGMLLRELEHDNLLKQYDVIIIDEAHERSLNIDFLLGYMRVILQKRPTFRLLISSATINTELFSKGFGNAPIISVSGRLFPVDIYYQPLVDDKTEKEAESEADVADNDYIFAASSVVEEIVDAHPPGDVLVFLPTERDIIELRSILDNKFGNHCHVLPLYGRMSLSDQQLVFNNLDKQKIVLATNIAETSVTVPNIRYVVDTGLARVKQYDAQMRITRLPIERISQASANQRAGRCGRVRDGVCIRLYSQEDLLTRPLFTLPEIQRANLAQVILSMASLHLGSVEQFPFLEVPPSRAVSQGYSQLHELGALDKEKRLTPLGKEMSRYPLDPSLSRMILEATQEHCVRQILIIAAGLCVQDIRVRPLEKKNEADVLHSRFTDPMSDFLFYLKLWDNAELGTKKSLTQLRKYCKQHFLSFQRMREWEEVHDQLMNIFNKQDNKSKGAHTATYEQLHRSITAGFISHIAKKTDAGDYQIAKGRKGFLFPGSALVKKKPDWIICGEIVETSRLFCRGCASIDPLWLESLAPHLCKHSYTEPTFDENTGTVKAKEKVSLFGLPIVENRTVAYGRINPKIANEIFIRDGLTLGLLQTHYKFFKHNSELRKRIETLEKKMRTSGFFAGDETMDAFYFARMPQITSIHDLNALIKEKGSDDFLFMKESDLTGEDSTKNPGDFPDSVTIGNLTCAVRYEFDTSSLHDGASIQIPYEELAFLNDNVFDWIIPGLYAPRIKYLLECLPKSFKKNLEPISETSQFLASILRYTGNDFVQSLCVAIEKQRGVKLDASSLSIDDLPHHLAVKVIVKKNKSNGSAYLNTKQPIQKSHTAVQSNSNRFEWEKQAFDFEKKNNSSWDFGDLPQTIEMISSKENFTVFGYPSLICRESTVDLVVFNTKDMPHENHQKGVEKLLELCLEKEIAWIERELKFDKHIQVLCMPYGKPEAFRHSLLLLVQHHIFHDRDFDIWKKKEFEQVLSTIKKEISSSGSGLLNTLSISLRDSTEFHSMIKKKLTACNAIHYKEVALLLKKELGQYILNLLDNKLNYNLFMQYPRYLRAFKYRIERAFLDYGKYMVKHQSIKSYDEIASSLLGKISTYSQEKQSLIYEFAEMLEEFKISAFAQAEIKTLYPVSTKRLDEKLGEIKDSI